MSLTQIERMALLKCRTAARFGRTWAAAATEEEALEEQRAVLATVPQGVYRKLARLGLIMLGPARLTDKGRSALGISSIQDTELPEGK